MVWSPQRKWGKRLEPCTPCLDPDISIPIEQPEPLYDLANARRDPAPRNSCHAAKAACVPPSVRVWVFASLRSMFEMPVRAPAEELTHPEEITLNYLQYSIKYFLCKY